MHIKIIEDETKSFIAEFSGVDRSVVDLIRERLLNSAGVEFASVEKTHPEIGSPRLVVKSTRNARSIVLKAVEELQEEVKELASQMPKK
jgi:DNA-directed RNA polymerase subunit L